MSLDWSSTSIEHARDAQERHGWSDEELLERLERVLRVGHVPDIAPRRGDLVAAYDALPAGTSVAARIGHLTGVLPALSGPWGSVFLADLLASARDAPVARRRSVARAAARTTPRSGEYDARRDWRRGLLIMLATWAALGALAVLVVRLG